MVLTPTETLIIILAVAAGTMITRFVPFILFPDKRDTPEYVAFLGKTLPAAMIGLLVVFCFKSVSLTAAPHGAPELIATVCIIALHWWRGSSLLSIGAGTALYMYLVQVVF